MDDNQLSLAVSHIPPRGMLLIEDIDCAFPSRDTELEKDEMYSPMLSPVFPTYPRSQITLSGLLNVECARWHRVRYASISTLQVVDALHCFLEEGRIFFATVEFVSQRYCRHMV